MKRILEPEVMDTPEEADGYDNMDHSGPNAAFVERLIELGARGQMLDIGCGPGHIPVLICDRIPDAVVTGIDLSGNMLRHARKHRDASPFAERIEYRLADAKTLDFPNDSFETVYSNTILHHIPDPRPFLSEAGRVLRAGGTLLIRDLFRPESPEAALELVAMHADGETSENRELLRASLHAALTPGELRVLADEVGLGAARLMVDTDRHMSLQIAHANGGN